MEFLVGAVFRLLCDLLFFTVGRVVLQAMSFGRLYCPKRYYRPLTAEERSTLSYDEWALSGSFSWGLWRKQPDGRVLVAAWLCEVTGVFVCIVAGIILMAVF